MENLVPLMLSVAVIAAILLAIAGARLIWRQNDRKRGALMLAVAVVIIFNLLIWSVPLPA